MPSVTFTVDLDDETLAAFDALAATKGHGRAAMLEQLVHEFLQFEAETPEYDAWFRHEVEEGLREMAEPGAEFVSDEEVSRLWASQKQELMRRLAGKLG